MKLHAWVSLVWILFSNLWIEKCTVNNKLTFAENFYLILCPWNTIQQHVLFSSSSTILQLRTSLNSVISTFGFDTQNGWMWSELTPGECQLAAKLLRSCRVWNVNLSYAYCACTFGLKLNLIKTHQSGFLIIYALIYFLSLIGKQHLEWWWCYFLNDKVVTERKWVTYVNVCLRPDEHVWQ